MTDIFTKYTELDPALEAAQIEAKVGSPVFDKWSYLDEARFNAQAAAALGGTLDLPALLDPARARAEFEAMAAADTGGGGGGYVAKAVHWDGTDGTQVLGGRVGFPSTSVTMLCAGFLGNCVGADGSGAGVAFNVGGGATGQLYLALQGNNDDTSFIDIELYDVTNSPIVVFHVYPFAKDLRTGWHSFAVYANTSTQTLQMVIDRAAVDTSSAVWSSSNQIALVSNDPYVFDTGSSGPGFACDFSNHYINFGDFAFDLSDVNNLNKLFTVDNKPVSWGSDGSLVTGSAPQVFLSGDATDYGANLGTGGAMVPTNFAYGDGLVITNATTSPSD